MNGLALADFLTDLRAELATAQARATADPDDPLRLRLDAVELSLEVAYTLERAGQADTRVKAKFWVLEFGEAGVAGSVSSRRVRTQHLKLVLTPRLERTAIDESGHATTVIREVDVHGGLATGEEHPNLPKPPVRD